MKPSVILYAVFLTVSLGIKAQQVDTVSYEVTKNMPVFYEQLKQQLTYPAAWGKSTTKDFGKWRIETRNIVMECMQNLPPAPSKYDMSVVGTEQRAGYEARKIWFNVSEWSRIPAYLLVPDGKGPFPAVIMLHDHGAHFSIGKEKMVQEWKYSEMPEIFTLKVSHYSITAMSHEVQPAEFEKPYYFSKQDFEITENTVTDLKELVCTLNNIKVRIAYDSELQKLLDEDSKVKVSVGEGRLEYAKDETRAGYFKSIGETNILIADLNATIQGEKVTMSKAFIDVLPGEERIIKYSMKQNSGGDGDNGEIGKVDIQIDATCEVVEKDITIAPGEEEPLPEPNPEPSPEPSPGTKPAITGKDFDITQSITIPPGVSTDNPYPVIVKIAVPEGIRNLKIGITSSSTDFANAISAAGYTPAGRTERQRTVQ